MKKQKNIREIVRQAGIRALIFSLILEGAVWGVTAFAVSRHHLVAILSYQLMLHLLLLLLVMIYGITLIIFITGIGVGILTKGEKANETGR